MPLTHRQVLVAIAAASMIALLSSCNRGGSRSADAPLDADDEYHVQPRRDDMPSVMQAKLAHAQAIMEGLALGDFRQIEVNARALERISQQADWLVHDTPSYYTMSDNFRTAVQTMAEHARQEDLSAVTRDYGALTASCIACHRYLKAERPTLQMPGRVSMIGR